MNFILFCVFTARVREKFLDCLHLKALSPQETNPEKTVHNHHHHPQWNKSSSFQNHNNGNTGSFSKTNGHSWVGRREGGASSDNPSSNSEHTEKEKAPSPINYDEENQPLIHS